MRAPCQCCCRKINASLSGQFVDDDLANAINPERRGIGTFNLSQILYSDSVWANLQIAGKRNEAVQQQRKSLQLDIILQTATAYLNILKAKTIERICKNNVKRSRTNLELARTRETLGVSSRSDVYRWQSEIATDRQEVLDAEATRRQAEVGLNQLLNRPQEELFITEQTALDDPVFLVSDPRFFNFLDNAKTYHVFRDFMVREGILKAPEIKVLELSIAAQRRSVLAAKRDFWVPDVSLDASYSDTFARGGTGGHLPPGVGDDGWSVGLSARIPLVTGGAHSARLDQTHEDLQRLTYERNSARTQIEARIRSALH